MPDYGHELAFGTFLTPQNQRPEDVVALAQLTEAAGLDLATFQDHPYQSAFLDTWTLLSWVAAQTETLRVAANVLNLPLRPPAVLARAAASLDLLSGGRVELGLGAGAFWDAIEAMGGPRRTPGEAVDALSEAIDVIRGIWDTGQRGGVRVRGEHYTVKGAKRGPAPAHDIEIWLGAYKPRMLRLTGRKADGWLPSLSYLAQQDIGAANRTIDEAALAAGRHPREIRRLLNITEADFDQLLGARDRARLQHVHPGHGRPRARSSASARRSRPRCARPSRPRAPRSGAPDRPGARRAGTRAAPRGHRLRRRPRRADARSSRATAAMTRSARVTCARAGRASSCARRTRNEVAEALAYARAQDVELAVRSGGHGISGRSTNDGGIVLDLGRLDEVTMLDGGRVRLGPGARWGQVAQTLAPLGLGMSSGDYGDVGVGGLATAGGIGFLGRKHGLTLDHVTAAEVVLADGRLVRADRDAAPRPLLGPARRGRELRAS